jgi:excisionase family DNA binding protein
MSGERVARGAAKDRGSYFTLQQAAAHYPVFTIRLLRRLVQERRIAFSRVGRRIVLAEADIEAYVEANRVELPTQSSRWHVAP